MEPDANSAKNVAAEATTIFVPQEQAKVATPGPQTTGQGDVATTTEISDALEGNARYELVDVIGTGGFGLVARCRDKQLGRDVAVKIPSREFDSAERMRFAREASIAASLSGPHIVRVYDVLGTETGFKGFVMELVEGFSFQQFLKNRARWAATPAELRKWMIESVLGLQEAHGREIIHRDIKPANLLVQESPPVTDGADIRRTLKIADFGLAKSVTHADGEDRITRSGLLVGTPRYMPPEQTRGQADKRSDLYSLGLSWYEILTGVLPFPGDGTVRNDPAPLTYGGTLVSYRLSALLRRLMDPDPDKRYQNTGELLRDLEAIPAEEFDLRGQAEKLTLRRLKIRRLKLGLLGACAALMLAFTIWYIVYSFTGNPEPVPSADPVKLFIDRARNLHGKELVDEYIRHLQDHNGEFDGGKVRFSGNGEITFLALEHPALKELAGIEIFSELKELSLMGSGVAEISRLTELQKLEVLDLRLSKVSETNLAAVKNFPRIKELRLSIDPGTEIRAWAKTRKLILDVRTNEPP